jgi:hypothetical protein
MKKVMTFAAVCLFVLTLCSCGSSNTPEAVATKAIKCIIDKNYDGYVDLMYFKKEKSNDDMKQIVALVKDKMDKEMEKKQGIKDFKVETATIDGDKATVPYSLTYGNGETKDDTMKLIKTEKGEWMIDSGK